MHSSWPVLVEIVLILCLGAVLYKLLSHSVRLLVRKHYVPDSIEPFFQGAVKWLVIVFISILLLRVFDIPLSQVITAMSALVVLFAIGFVAMWSVLSNILCAFLLLAFPAFRFGDEIELREPDKEKGVRGRVVSLNMFHTTLKSSGDDAESARFIRIPNVLFFQRIIYCHENEDTWELKFGDIKDMRE